MANSVLGVNFCLIRDDKILLQKRDDNCPYFPHQWCIPGGSREENESFLDTVIREVAEEYELTLTSSDCVYIGTKSDGQVWLCNVPNNQAPIMHEGEAMQWFEIDTLTELELGFNQTTEIVPQLLSFLKIYPS